MSKQYYIKKFVILEENNNEAIAGPNPPVKSLYSMVQDGIDQSDIITYQETDYELLLTEGTTKVYVKYFDKKPTINLSGASDEQVTITCLQRPLSFIVHGTDSNVVDGYRTITFRGAGIPGNTSSSHIVTPVITKISSTLADFGNPSISNPYSVDQDNNPSVDIVGIGNSTNPSISLRFGNLNFSNHILQFDWK
jgi:hypothetical protein